MPAESSVFSLPCPHSQSLTICSEFRTTDPDDADYFFVPFLNSCYIFLGDDHPRHRMVHGCRMIAAAQASKSVTSIYKPMAMEVANKEREDHDMVMVL